MKLNAWHLPRSRSPLSLRTRLLVYLLLLSSIPVSVMGIISAYNTSRIIRSQAMQSNAMMLKQTEKEMNAFFKKIDDLMLQYTYASSTSTLIVKRFVEEDLSSSNWILVMDLGEMLVKLQSGMEHVLELDFYSVPYGKVLSSRGMLFNDGQYTDPLALDVAKKLNYSNGWVGLRMQVTKEDPLNRPVLTIIKPVFQNNRVDAALIVYLDATAISSYKFTLPDANKGSSIFVCDEQGNIVLHSQTAKIGTRLDASALQIIRESENQDWIREEKLSIDGVPYISTVLHSDMRDWYYVSAIPEKTFTEKPNAQRNILLGISMALLAAALLISYCASRTLYRPLKQLTNRLRLSSSGGDLVPFGDEVELLGYYLESLNIKNEQLSRDMNIYSDHARHFMLHQLLVGHMPIHNAPLTDIELIGVNRLYIPLLIVDLNSIMMIQKYSKHDCSLYYFAVDNMAREIFEDHEDPHIIMIQPGMFVIVLPVETPPSSESLRSMGHRLLDAIRRYLKLDVYVAVSCSDTGTAGLHDAFVEATGLLRYRFILGDNQVVLTHDLETSVSIQADALFQYENDIILAVRERKWSEAESLFLTITEALQESFNISEELLRGYFLQLLNGIVKTVCSPPQGALDATQFQELPPRLAQCRTLEEMRSFFRENVFHVLHQKGADTQGTPQRIQMVHKVLKYIETQYDKDLSLQQCAELVHLNSFDLSRLFKQIQGVNFIDYLIEFRMEKAKEMLSDPQIRMQDIAEKLRYSSQQGFMRAFKKSTGMTPGQYRSKLKE